MRIFVSYHGTPDRAIAERLAAALCARGDGIEVFLDTYALQPGAFWLPALAEELEHADAVVLLLGKNGPGPWQTLEFYEALDRKAKQPDFPVIPVVLTDPAPRLPFLGQLHWLRFDDPAAEPALEKLLPVLRGEPLPRMDQPWKMVNPYRGLLALTEVDADVFFGRDALTGEILDRLCRGERGLMLVGNSGVGKSSLLQAGVIAALRRQRWPGTPADSWPHALSDSRAWLFLTMTPGDHPLYELAFAFVRLWLDPERAECGERCAEWEASFLAGRQGLHSLLRATREKVAQQNQGTPPRFVLVVDQSEELYYTRVALEERGRFSRLLAEVADLPKLVVLGSLRSDHYGCLQEDEPLFRSLARVDVSPLREPELREVIDRPPALLGVRFENNAMVAQIAAAAAGEPGALPLLSYLLEELWTAMQARGDGVLHAADYAAAGELRGVLSRRAENYYSKCSPAWQRALERLFTLRLAHVLAEGAVVRRRAHRDECSDEEWRIAQELAGPRWRLLVTGEEAGQPTVEVAHEILLRRWDRLAGPDGWLAKQRGFLQWKSQLEQNRKDWQAETDAHLKDCHLLRDLWLDRALHWLAERGEDLASDDRAFIQASQALRECERAAADRRRRKITLASLAAAAVMAVLLVAAIWQHDEALIKQSRDLVDRSQQETQAGNATNGILLALEALKPLSRAVIDDILLALKALSKDMISFEQPHVAEAESALYRALYTAVSHHREKNILEHKDRISSAAFSRDGKRVVTASWDGTARLWNVDGRPIGGPLCGHQEKVYFAEFSPDGKLVVTASEDCTARLWDADGQPIGEPLRGHKEGVTSAAFSRDGQRIVTTSKDGTARLWDADGQPIGEPLRGHEQGVTSAEFSPNGQRVVTTSKDGTVQLWDADGRSISQPVRGHTDWVWSVAFSPDGQRVVTASKDGTARLWDAATGEPIGEPLRGHEQEVTSAAFSPDGQRVVTTSKDGTARLWDADGQPIGEPLRGHKEGVTSAAFSPDGKLVVTASEDGTARLWDAGKRKVYPAAFSPDGKRVITSSWDEKTAWLWDAESGQERAVLVGHKEGITSAAFSPDGKRVVTTSWDRTARLWDAATGEPIGEPLRGHEQEVTSAAFSPDGKRVVTTSWDRTARLWDAESGQERAVLVGHKEGVTSATFSPDGKRVVTTSKDGTARLWELGDAATGQPIGEPLRGHEQEVTSAAFSPDGQRIVTASKDGTVQLWDADGQPIGEPLVGHKEGVTTAEFSPDGKLVVTASEDDTARLWDAESGQERAVLVGHKEGVTSAAFSPDGTRVVTASKDGTARLWELGDAATGQPIGEPLVGHEQDQEVTSAAFSRPDGKRVVTTSKDGTARLWDARTARLWRVLLNKQKLTATARRLVLRSLTAAQRRQFFPEATPLENSSQSTPSATDLACPLDTALRIQLSHISGDACASGPPARGDTGR